MDETWLYRYDPETKQQSMEWRHSGSPRPKYSECKNPLENFSPRFFGIKTASSLNIFQRSNYQRRVLLISAGAIEGLVKEKRLGKITKGVLFLHDNAPAHRALATHKKLAHLGFQCLDHPPYSPELAPSDYRLFLGLKKKQLKSRRFSSDAEVIAAAETWLDGQPSDFFLSGLQVRETG